jgi:mannosylglucosylglycerate synthase
MRSSSRGPFIGAPISRRDTDCQRHWAARWSRWAALPRAAFGLPSASHYRFGIPTAVVLSFRLGGSDGVAVEAAKWQSALSTLGFDVRTVAGSGRADRLVPGLAADAGEPPAPAELTSALDDADLVVVENLCSLPLNPAAAAGVARALAGRPAVLHHHDLPWQRPQFAGHPPPPTDARWRHVTVNELSRRQLAERGIGATTIYNAFAVPHIGGRGPGGGAPDGDERATRVRRALDVASSERLVLQPTRALARKNVGGGMTASAALDAVYWLLGPAEDGYDEELARLVAAAPCAVRLGPPPGFDGLDADDAYRACDVVVLPSTWEGFGNPSVESAVHRRPLLIGPYPVAGELAAFGFRWFGLDETEQLGTWLDDPDPGLLDHNQAVAARHFSLRDLPGRIAAVLPPL